MSNTIRTDKGIEVYESEIHRLADEYIRDLADDDSECTMLIRKAPVFKGMLKYVYINLFKITDKDIRYNDKNSNLDYSNIDLINNVWDIYTSLCYKYLQSPTILNFSLLTVKRHASITTNCKLFAPKFSMKTTRFHRHNTISVVAATHCRSFIKSEDFLRFDKAMTYATAFQNSEIIKLNLVKRLGINSGKNDIRIDGFLVKLCP